MGHEISQADNGGNSTTGPDDSLLYGSGSSQSFMRPSSQPQCTVCNMKFSNRANARRHERNIHGILPNPMLMMNNSHNNQVSISAPMRGVPRRFRRVPMLPEPKIVFDYEKPELYRELITDSKLYFIKRHIEFLEQYQNMRCKCCNRDFPTYKFFMAHMRKKYDTLSRNLCFKCLKQFETKSQFISHLKKKNCINLYKVYCADDTISKDPLPPVPTARTGSKEIIANKVYGCKLCTKTFRLKVDFRGHVYETHADETKEQMGTSCGFCKTDFEEPALRRRHYNNLECIVFLICGTCDEKFDNLAQYIEHVYGSHLQPVQPEANGLGPFGEPLDMAEASPAKLDAAEPADALPLAAVASTSTAAATTTTTTAASNSGLSTVIPTYGVPSNSGSDASYAYYDEINNSGDIDPMTTRLRYPQNCKVCGKQYNNYYNVLRHMESKHPNQLPATYRCEQCNVGYPRQLELREHMYKIHGVALPKIKRELFSCRACGACFDSKRVWLDHQATNHSKYFCHQCDMETESITELETHLLTHRRYKMYKCTLCQHSFNSERGLETHLAVMHAIKKEQMPQSSDDGEVHTNQTMDDEDDADDDDEMMMDDDDDDDEDGYAGDHSAPNDNTKARPVDVRINGDTDKDQSTAAANEIDDDVNIETPPVKKIKLENNLLTSVGVNQMAAKLFDTSTPIAGGIVGAQNIRQCPLCHETFSGGIAIANHMRTHGIPSIRPPKVPRQIMPKPVRPIGVTMPKAHVSSRMRCRICQKRIHTKASYKRHMLNVHGVSDCVFIRCTLCPAEFSNDKGLKVHMFRTHNITVQQMQQDERLRPIPKQESTAAGSTTSTIVTTGSFGPGATGLGKTVPKLKLKLMFECDICHTVYRSQEQLRAHRSVVHGTGES